MFLSLLCGCLLAATLPLGELHKSSLECNAIPPGLWCSNQELDTKCGFDTLCNKYLEANQGKALQITIIFESLCPYSASFLVDVYYPHVYQKFGKLVKTELLPYGNAYFKNGAVVCSHGPVECQVNAIEVCAIHFLQEPLPFVYCLGKNLGAEEELEKALKYCFHYLSIPPKTAQNISKCSKSKIGSELRNKTMDRIKQMKPQSNDYVPWLAFNDVSLESSQYLSTSLNSTICQWLVTSKSIEPSKCQ